MSEDGHSAAEIQARSATIISKKREGILTSSKGTEVKRDSKSSLTKVGSAIPEEKLGFFFGFFGRIKGGSLSQRVGWHNEFVKQSGVFRGKYSGREKKKSLEGEITDSGFVRRRAKVATGSPVRVAAITLSDGGVALRSINGSREIGRTHRTIASFSKKRCEFLRIAAASKRRRGRRCRGIRKWGDFGEGGGRLRGIFMSLETARPSFEKGDRGGGKKKVGEEGAGNRNRGTGHTVRRDTLKSL